MFKNIVVAGLMAASTAGGARAASVYTETFPADFAGWDATMYTYIGYWDFQAQRLVLVMDFLPDFSGPDAGFLKSSASASGGRFYGNWLTTTSRIDGVGFELTAENISPSSVQMTLYNDNTDNPYYGTLPPPPPGTTEAYYLPVDTFNPAWFGAPINSAPAFAAVLSNVTELSIQIWKNTDAAQTCRVDNIFVSQAFQWDGGTNGLGTNWLTATNWYANGIPGANSRILFGSTGAATVVAVDSSQATGGVLQVGQMFCTVSNRTFENSSTTTNSKIRFNGFGGIFVSAGSNVVTFRNGAAQPLELVGARYRGIFDVADGGAIIVTNSRISETGVVCRIEKTGGGLLFLGASNTFSGGARVRGGVLRVGNTNALGPGALTADGGLLDLNGFAITVPRLLGATGIVSDASADTGTNTLTVNQNTNTFFTGMFADGTAKVVALTKAGTGTLVIAGTNLNSGTTSVNAGRLLLDANGDSGGFWRTGELGPGRVLVATGAVFGGAGHARGAVDNAGTVIPGTGVLVCANGYVQRTNGILTFMLGGTNAAMNQDQYTSIVVTNINAGITNIVTNTVLQTALYQRLEISGPSVFGGLLRAPYVNGFTPNTGDIFHLITAPLYVGFFSTNSLHTNNIPSPGPGREWGLWYRNDGISLECAAAGTQPRAFVASTYGYEGDTGQSNLLFHVVLSKPATAAVSVAWTVVNGTALAGSDFLATNGLLVIPPGSFFGQIAVPVLGDTSFEYNETLSLQITALTNATAGSTNGTGHIFNDDPLPFITIGTVATNESAAFNLPLTLSVAIGVDASITVATSNGTALAGFDYAATNFTLTIPAGTTNALIPLPVFPDTLYEPDETFTVRFAAPSNSILSTTSVLVTILNDDPYPELTFGTLAQNEGDSGTRAFNVPVNLSTPTTVPVTFTIATTTNGTASPGVDFFTTNASITITAGVTTSSFTILVISDPNTEPNEAIVLRLSSATNAAISSEYGSVTILDDDFNPYPGFLGFVQQIPDGQQRGYFDDPDGDGQPNIYEYAFLSNPNDSASLGLFHAAAQAGIPGIRFGRNLNSTDIIIEIETAERLLETITPGDEENEIPPITNAVTWYNIATNLNGIWTGLTTVVETGLTNPITVFVHDPSPPGLTNRYHRLIVRPPP